MKRRWYIIAGVGGVGLGVLLWWRKQNKTFTLGASGEPITRADLVAMAENPTPTQCARLHPELLEDIRGIQLQGFGVPTELAEAIVSSCQPVVNLPLLAQTSKGGWR